MSAFQLLIRWFCPGYSTTVLLMAAVQRQLGKSSGTGKGHAKDPRRPRDCPLQLFLAAGLSGLNAKCCDPASRKRSGRCWWGDACVSCLRRKIPWARLTNPEGFSGPLRFSEMCPLSPIIEYAVIFKIFTFPITSEETHPTP